MGLPTMLLLVASAAEAQFSPWVSQASITGDSQLRSTIASRKRWSETRSISTPSGTETQ